MKRQEQRAINLNTIKRLLIIAQQNHCFIPSYKLSVNVLNSEGYATSRGNTWTPHRLVRMLQRNQISGLYGLGRLSKKGHFPTT